VETSRVIILSKPSGVSCFPYRKDPSRVSMLEIMLAERSEQQQDWPAGFEGGIAHRLDVPTSGQLLVAKNPSILTELREDFTNKKLLKRYQFLTRKSVEWTAHQINFPMAHHKTNRRKMVVKRGHNTPHRGKWLPATTNFQHLASQNGLHLWEATMRTGVMHQIRLHAAMAGLALVGDQLYGGGKAPEYFPSDFALHHCGIQSEKWQVPFIPVPKWWPDWTKTPHST